MGVTIDRILDVECISTGRRFMILSCGFLFYTFCFALFSAALTFIAIFQVPFSSEFDQLKRLIMCLFPTGIAILIAAKMLTLDFWGVRELSITVLLLNLAIAVSVAFCVFSKFSISLN